MTRSHPLLRCTAWPVMAALAALTLPALAAPQPYPVEVRARVLFDPQGQVHEMTVMDETTLPAAFVANVKASLGRATIAPMRDGDQPVPFRTGVVLTYWVTPGEDGQAGQVQLRHLQFGPLPLERRYASYPKDIAHTPGWEGDVEARCTVTVEGVCGAIEVTALPGMPDSVRRFARATLEGWTFEPQELNGRKVEGRYEMKLHLRTREDYPQDFRQPAFERMIRGR